MSDSHVSIYTLPDHVHGRFEVGDGFAMLPLIAQADLLNNWQFQIQRRYRHTLMLLCFELLGPLGIARPWDEKLLMISAMVKSLGLELPHDFRELARRHLTMPIVRDHASCKACTPLE